MCHIRGFKHIACGHTTYRRISACRGTYASPRAPDTPRCSPSASIVVAVSENCRECEYQVFCDDWQRRIDDMRSRRDSFQTLLSDMNLESSDDYWGCELEDELEYGYAYGNSSDPSQPRPRRRSTAPAKLIETPANFCDSASLREERNRLNDEIERLNAQYNQDAWREFKPFVGGMSESYLAQAARMRRRKRAPRYAGASPLREMTSTEDLSPIGMDIPEIIEEEPDLSCGSSDSDESSGSISPTSTSSKSSDSAFWAQLSDDSLKCPLSAQALASVESGGMAMQWRSPFGSTPKIVETAPPAPQRSLGLTGKLKRLQAPALKLASEGLQVPKSIGRRLSLSPNSASPTGGMLPKW